MKSTKKNSAQVYTMAIGIITALMVIFSQLFFFQSNSYAKKEVKTKEHHQKQNTDTADITLPSISQQHSSTHVEPDQKSSCLFEIIFEEDEEERSIVEIPLLFGKFFKMLFHVIISPNAP